MPRPVEVTGGNGYSDHQWGRIYTKMAEGAKQRGHILIAKDEKRAARRSFREARQKGLIIKRPNGSR